MYSVGDSGEVYSYYDPTSVRRAWENGDYVAAGMIIGHGQSDTAVGYSYSDYQNSSSTTTIKVPAFLRVFFTLIKYYIYLNILYFVLIGSYTASKIANHKYDAFVKFIPLWSHDLLDVFLTFMKFLENV